MSDAISWNAVAKVGIPGVIAMFLVWRLSSGFDMFETRLKAIEQQQIAATATSENAKELAKRALATNERVLWVLQIMCTNDAKNNDARERCLRTMP